jgi:hypothetical protein
MRPARPPLLRAVTATLLALAMLLTVWTGPGTTGPGPAAHASTGIAAGEAEQGSVGAMATRAPRIRAPLRTRKGNILDRSGRRVRLLSLAFNQLGPGDGQRGKSARGCTSWNPIPSYAYEDVQRWGFNSVRLLISWANLEPAPPTRHDDGTITRNWNQEYLQALDDAIKGFTQRGIAVVLEMKQVRWSPAFSNLPVPGGNALCEGWGLPKWLYPDGGGLRAMVEAKKRFFIRRQHQPAFVNAWRFVARRYADNRMVVGADIINEPYDLLTASWPGARKLRPRHLKLAGFYERVGKAIHRENPRLLVLFQEFRSRRLNMWSLTRKPRLNRAVMDNHFYAAKWIPQGRQWLEQAHRRARAWNLPLWVGEFMAFNRSVGLPDRRGWAPMTRKMLTYAKRRGIGWAVWLYGPGAFQRADDIRTPKPRLLPVIRSGF